MHLSSLHLENFRNFPALNLEFDPARPLTVIHGKNGQGKSNLIESIHLLSMTKSFREPYSRNLISWEKPFARVKGIFRFRENIDQKFCQILSPKNHSQSIEESAAEKPPSVFSVNSVEKNQKNLLFSRHLEYFHQRSPTPLKHYKINENPHTASSFWGTLKSVLFSPEQLEKFFAEPAQRRSYLDQLLATLDKKNLEVISIYATALKQKSALLKQISPSKSTEQKSRELQFWNAQIAEQGSRIIIARLEIIEHFNQKISQLYQQISQKEQKLLISYKNQLTGPLSKKSIRQGELQEKIFQALMEKQTEEIFLKKCLIGPHLDDLTLTLDRQQVKHFCSRGEKRSIFLALKQAEIALIEETCGHKPVLLFDDIFSELDQQRSAAWLKLLDSYQSIVTTLTLTPFHNRQEATIYEISNGNLTKKTPIFPKYRKSTTGNF